MKRQLLSALVLLMVAAPAFEAHAQYAPTRGKRGRKNLRRVVLVNSFKNDKLIIYRRHGFPVHRLRERGYGRVTEHWTYYEKGLEFVFDEESRLVETKRFWPENKRERFERF